MTTTLGSHLYGGTGLTLGQLDEMPRYEREAVLAATIALQREGLEELKRQLAESESYLRDAMLARGASVADAGEWEVKLAPRRRYEYDAEHLSKLQGFVEADQYEAAVKEVRTVKVDKRVLNQLAKRGGEVAVIIEHATTEQIGGWDMEITRRRLAA